MTWQRWQWWLPAVAATITAMSSARGQQVNDPGFRFANAAPAFPQGAGPRVCIDEAHQNVHTMSQRYAPFAEILRSDGFRVTGFTQSLSRETLEPCHILILGSGRAPSEPSSDLWAYPYASANARSEVDAVVRWVHGGGALLFAWDHAPAAGAAAELANLLGVQPLDAWSDVTPRGRYPEVTSRKVAGDLRPRDFILTNREERRPMNDP